MDISGDRSSFKTERATPPIHVKSVGTFVSSLTSLHRKSCTIRSIYIETSVSLCLKCSTAPKLNKMILIDAHGFRLA